MINVIGYDPSVISDRELRDRTGPAVESCACYIFEPKLHQHCLKKAQCASVRHDNDLLIGAFDYMLTEGLYSVPKVSVRLCILKRSVIGIIAGRRDLMLVISIPRLAIALARIHLSDKF